MNECRRADITPFGQNHHVTVQRSTGGISHEKTKFGPFIASTLGTLSTWDNLTKQQHVWVDLRRNLTEQQTWKNSTKHQHVWVDLRRDWTEQQYIWVEEALQKTLTDQQQAENTSVHVNVAMDHILTATTHSHGLAARHGDQTSMRLMLEAIIALETIVRAVVGGHASRTTVRALKKLEALDTTQRSGLDATAVIQMHSTV